MTPKTPRMSTTTGNVRQPRARRGQRGMTLIEIVLVLAILGVVMGILFFPRLRAMFSESKESATKILVDKFAFQAYTQWNVETGDQCPNSLDDIAKYISKKNAKDPYRTPMQMVCGPDAPEDAQGFGVISAGPDKKHGTEDDIKSWESMEERKARMKKSGD